jgi:hypothetical protein
MKDLMPAAVLMLMVSIGMSLDRRALVANWRRLDAFAWVRLPLVTFLVPPALALLLARVFGLSLIETAGLFLVGVVPRAALLLAAGALGVVHLLARRKREVVETLSTGNANRHVGLAVPLSGQYLHAQAAIPAVACYALAAAIAIGLYVRFVARGPDGP